MESRMKTNGQVSPERAKVWREKSPKYYYNYEKYNQQKQLEQHQRDGNGKAPVVYYLCRNGQLDHPHFMEVALSSDGGLYLRDVIERLNALRGRGMASMYSWSCKRSHKGGYVWHDLCEDDLLIPAHGNEYVLKGIELFQEPNHGCFSPVEPLLLQNQKAVPEPPSSSRSQEYSSSSSSLSPESGETSWNGSLSLTEYKAYKGDCLLDASTQTEERTCKDTENLKILARDVITKDHSLEQNASPNQNRISGIKETPDNSSTCSSGRTEALLESRITDARKLNSFRILEEEEFITVRPNARFNASNMLLQLISCGSISVKDHHSFGLVPTYKPMFSHSKLESPLFPMSIMAREVDFLRDNRHLKGLRLEDKEYFSGSLVETCSMVKEDGLPTFKRSSSYSNGRSDGKADLVKGKEDAKFASSKFIPRSHGASLTNQPRSESMRSSPIVTKSPCNNGGGKRLTETTKDGENVIKIEERLASGARVIIQQSSKVAADNGTAVS